MDTGPFVAPVIMAFESQLSLIYGMALNMKEAGDGVMDSS